LGITAFVDAVDRLHARVRHYRGLLAAGTIMVFDNFEPDGRFNRSASRSATTAPRGNPPGDQDVAMAFDVFGDADLELEEVSAALNVRSGDGEYDLWIAPDQGGRPDHDAALEQFRGRAQRPVDSARVVHRSVQRPRLRAGRRYWLVLSAIGEGAEVVLWTAPIDFAPQPASVGIRRDGGEWKTMDSPSGPGFAVAVRCLLAN
jgi:hypothetical protein